MDNTSRYFEKIFLNLGLMEASRILSTVLIFLNARASRKSQFLLRFSREVHCPRREVLRLTKFLGARVTLA